MIKNQNSKKYDLEERTLEFSKRVIDLVNKLPRNSINIQLISQVIRSAGSIGANYREANEALGKKDFYMRTRISRKEAKETQYWLELILYNNKQLKVNLEPLIRESIELLKIFSAIISKYS